MALRRGVGKGSGNGASGTRHPMGTHRATMVVPIEARLEYWTCRGVRARDSRIMGRSGETENHAKKACWGGERGSKRIGAMCMNVCTDA